MKLRMLSRSWRPLALLLALSLGLSGAASPAGAQEACPSVEGDFTGANAIFQSGQESPREGIFSLALQPAGTVDYLSGARRVKGDGGYGGVLVLRTVLKGRYRLFLSSPVEIELIQNYLPLSLTDCRGEQSSYLVTIGEGKVVLQVRGAVVPLIDIAFLKL
jgi:hypothetical protein